MPENLEMGKSIAVVLAAGKGTRMKSDLPKVLMPVAGRAMIEYVLDAVEDAGVSQTLVVVGYQAALVRESLKDRKSLTFVEQTEQLGTGHAVQVCVPYLADFNGAVLIVTGDSPLTQVTSLRRLLSSFHEERAACVLGTLIKDDPTGLGRIVRNAQGEFEGIVEHKDATPEQLLIQEVNMSTYVFDCQRLLPALAELRADNRQQEYYITDCPGILRTAGGKVLALPVLQPCEAMSINSLEDLQAVERVIVPS